MKALRRELSAGQGAGTAPTDTRVDVAHNSGGYRKLGRGGFREGWTVAGAWRVTPSSPLSNCPAYPYSLSTQLKTPVGMGQPPSVEAVRGLSVRWVVPAGSVIRR